jgi:hypothetical protein
MKRILLQISTEQNKASASWQWWRRQILITLRPGFLFKKRSYQGPSLEELIDFINEEFLTEYLCSHFPDESERNCIDWDISTQMPYCMPDFIACILLSLPIPPRNRRFSPLYRFNHRYHYNQWLAGQRKSKQTRIEYYIKSE